MFSKGSSLILSVLSLLIATRLGGCERILVLLDSLNTRETHSLFFKSLAGLKYFFLKLLSMIYSTNSVYMLYAYLLGVEWKIFI